MDLFRVSSAVTVTALKNQSSRNRFVVTNEATGRHFAVDHASVLILESLRQHGNLHRAALDAGVSVEQTAQLAEQLAKYGIVTNGGGQATSAVQRQPIEGNLVSFRADLANAE